jgi:hypothetical protein
MNVSETKMGCWYERGGIRWYCYDDGSVVSRNGVVYSRGMTSGFKELEGCNSWEWQPERDILDVCSRVRRWCLGGDVPEYQEKGKPFRDDVVWLCDKALDMYDRL